MKSKILLTLVVAAMAAPLSFAQTAAPQAMAFAASAPGKGMVAETIKITATVVAIDSATRTATLKRQDGKVVDVIVPPEAKNFDKVKVGDRVVVEYTRALSLELKKSGSAIREGSMQTATAPAPAGAVGGGAVANQVVVLADVEAVNIKTSSVTLRGPKGNLVELTVPDPGQLKLVKKGDQVEAVYTEAVAITVEHVAKVSKP